MIADLPNGRTVIRIISQRVAPSASAPSCRRRGVCVKTERVTAVMIGRIITREHEADDQHRAAGRRRRALEERDEAELVREPLEQPTEAGPRTAMPQRP